MKLASILVVLCAVALYADAFGVITVTGAGLAGLLGLKLLAAKTVAVGAALGAAAGRRRSYYGGRRRSYRRWGRSVEDETEAADLFLETSVSDSDDCAKKLVCFVNAKPLAALSAEMKPLYSLFNRDFEGLDLASDSIEFDTAALIGRKVGLAQCEKIYARCKYSPEQLVDAFLQPNMVQ